jgi:arabinose-5-phosphate isomerase
MTDSNFDDLTREVARFLATEAEALKALGTEAGEAVARAAQKILACRGRIVVTGMGKAGIIGQKISATLASTGTPSLFLHAAEALHGDLGRVKGDDIVLALSNSGGTAEVVGLLGPIKKIGAGLLCITGNPASELARYSDEAICYGNVIEAGPLGLAPTTSTTVMLILGDALAMAVLSQRKFSKEEFALFHPAGALGRRLIKVHEVMRAGEQNPVIGAGQTVVAAMKAMTHTPGRPGAVSVVDDDGRIVGFYSDGDLRRGIENSLAGGDFAFLESPISAVMTRDPIAIGIDQLAGEAMRILREKKIDQIPVVDDQNRPVGLLDVQDLLTVRIV